VLTCRRSSWIVPEIGTLTRRPAGRIEGWARRVAHGEGGVAGYAAGHHSTE